MSSLRPGFRNPALSQITPLSSAFCDRVNRRHPLGNILAVASTVMGVILILAASL